MNSVSGSFESNPPAALALAFLPALPEMDRRPEFTSYGFSLAFYDAPERTPEESILLPTLPAETMNYTAQVTETIPFSSGYSSVDSSGTVEFYRPNYVGTHPSGGTLEPTGALMIKPVSNDEITHDRTLSQIRFIGGRGDSADSWFPLLENGMVYRDHIVTAEELYHTNAPTGGEATSGFYSGSWLKNAGYIAGDRLRLIYTLPSLSLHVRYSEMGNIFRNTSQEGVHIAYGEAVHDEDGRIALDSRQILYIDRMEEIGNLGIRQYWNNTPVSGDYTTATGSATEWNLNKGFLTLLPPPSPGNALSAAYVKERAYLEYRGYWDERRNLWQGLDLNPQSGHLYNSGVDPSGRVDNPSEDLLHRTITLYLLPVAAMKLDDNGLPAYPITYASAYAEGGKDYRWCPLRHYVPPLPRGASSGTTTLAEAATWGYAIFDSDVYAEPAEFSATEKGIPRELNSALLLGRIRVRPKERIHVEDARRFSGLPGTFDRKGYTGSDEDPRTVRWDTSVWETLSAPLGGSVLIEVDAALIAAEGLDAVQAAVEMALPPGIVAVIRPV